MTGSVQRYMIQEKTKTDSNSAKPNSMTFVVLIVIVRLTHTCLSNWT